MRDFGKYLSVILVGLLCIALTSCRGSSDGDESAGRLSLALSDAPASDYRAVYVTIAQIQVHKADAAEDQWQTILTPNATYNLLDLINGTTADLGVADLSTGTYTQMRLILANTPDTTANLLEEPHPYANYLITSGNETIELKVPSGFQTGIKLVHTFEVESGRTVGLVLDFDAGRSVVKAGNSGNWLLKPTIKVIGTVNNATLTGTVRDVLGNPVAGATVSVQTYDADTDEATVVQATITGSTEGHQGEYLMYLQPGTYTIVVTADGFVTAYSQITAVYDMDYTENFTLGASLMGSISLDLTLPTNVSGEPAIIKFRQNTPEYGMIAVKEVNFSESGSYDVSLPVGTYSIVAVYDDQENIVRQGVITGQSIPIDFTQP